MGTSHVRRGVDEPRRRRTREAMTQQLEAAAEAPTPVARLYDRRTLLVLSFSEHVHVPKGMASFDEWYGYVQHPHADLGDLTRLDRTRR